MSAKMNFTVMTLFPDVIMQMAASSITGRAIESGIISVRAVDIRDYTHNRFRHVDDYPYGGGAGMVIEAAPVIECYEDIVRQSSARPHVIYMSPRGRVFSQKIARELSVETDLVLLCGHYEGIDQRAIDRIVDEEISIGDYVLTGGELPALVVMDAVSRMIPGVLGNESSAEDESFSGMWLEYPQYTRPRELDGQKVPEVLLNGNHAEIETWRLKESMKMTMKRRPDLIDPEKLSKKEKKIYLDLLSEMTKNQE